MMWQHFVSTSTLCYVVLSHVVSLTWQMTQFIHELLLHLVVVMARVMFCVRVFVVLWLSVLMMSWLCCFLRFWFGWLSSPPDSDPIAAQPHAGCQNSRISALTQAV